MSEDLYELGENTRKAGSSYDTAPVVMQFGEREGLTFPCIYIKTSPEGLKKHMLMSLANLVKSNLSEMRYAVYMDAQSSVSELGTIDSKSLATLLTSAIFSDWDIEVRADKDTAYSGDMRLAFCSC